jgi:putative hemolysin
VPSPYQFLGAVHPLVRTALLPRVLAAQRGTMVAVRFGHPIPASQLERFADDRGRVDYLRLRSDILARRLLKHTPLLPGRPLRAMAELAPAEDRAALAAEIAALPAAAELLRSGDHTVRVARAAAIPVVLREIGRLRELTFRGVGEGSGQPRDLDRFDDDYLHLFVWHETDQELVGAYRLGPTDELVAQRGAEGLYTATLWRFAPGFLARMQPALELGRSFVQPRYQKSHAALLLLWRGIGAFVARQPRYRLLFGPVSISGQHDTASVRLIVAHLQAHCADPELQEHVTPRRPWRVPARLRRRMPVDGALLGDLDGVGAMVRELEVGRQGVPVLLEQYLRLGARVVGCNLDPDFGTLDALVVVDLLRTAPQRARRYLGEQGLEALRAWHAAPAP